MIRPLVLDRDGEALHDLYRQRDSTADTGASAGVITAIARQATGVCWGMWSAEALCGCACFRSVAEELELIDIFIAPKARRRGYARALLQTALEHGRNHGVLNCLLEVRASNDAARALYAELGFEIDGIRANYYRATSVLGCEDAILMSRRIRQ